MADDFLWGRPLSPIGLGGAQILLLGLALSLSGCVTAWTVVGMGKDLDGTITDMKASTYGKQLVFEATTEYVIDVPKMGHRHYWTQVDEEGFFSKPAYDSNSFSYSSGQVPTRITKHLRVLDENGCLTAKSTGKTLLVRDSCSGMTRETKVALMKPYEHSHRWRKVALPVAVPVSVAADIALTPLYAGYMTYCMIRGCPK